MENLLTRRQQLGYDWEMRVQREMSGVVEYEGNPSCAYQWVAKIEKGSDIKVPILGMDIECKYVNHKVYPCHIVSCYKPRFRSNTRHKVVCTNEKSKFSHKARESLETDNIKLMTLSELIAKIFQLLSKAKRRGKEGKPTTLVKESLKKMLRMLMRLLLQEQIGSHPASLIRKPPISSQDISRSAARYSLTPITSGPIIKLFSPLGFGFEFYVEIMGTPRHTHIGPSCSNALYRGSRGLYVRAFS